MTYSDVYSCLDYDIYSSFSEQNRKDVHDNRLMKSTLDLLESTLDDKKN